MADEEQKNEEAAGEQAAEGAKKGWRRFVTKRNTITLVLVTLIIQGGVFAYFQLFASSSNQVKSHEYSLGHFYYLSKIKSNKGVMRADFDLHIKLLADMNRSGRMHLENHKFTIQQDIEELLRLAAAGDFADPRLVEIKRQLQEQINQTLTKRVIEDVIITNLVVIRAEDATAAQNVPKKKNIQAPKAQSTNPQWEQPTAEAES